MAGNKRIRKVVVSETGEERLVVSATDAKIPDATTKLLVGEVEQLTGVSKAKLRRYEDAGVLCPERTGEGVSNNRKLYGIDDLSRLQAITALREYNFTVQEIGPILDNEVDLYDALSTKLIELKRRENQLRNLGLFAHFAEATGSDLIESLGFGPAELDSLANIMRDTSPYDAALAKLETYTDDEAEHAFVDLDKILLVLPYVDKNDTFAKIASEISSFVAWWNSFVWPLDNLGCLGFWAVYEDHTFISERIQTIAGPDYVAYIEMFVFFDYLLKFLVEQGARIKRIAQAANEDILIAIEEITPLSEAIIDMLIGNEVGKDSSQEDHLNLSLYILEVIRNIIRDEKLNSYLGLTDQSNDDVSKKNATTNPKKHSNSKKVVPNSDDIEHVAAVYIAMGGDAGSI